MDPVAAAAANHQSWNAALAAVTGGWVERLEPGSVTYVPTGGGDLQVLYTTEADDVGGVADRVLARAPALGGVRDLGWWATGAGGELGGRLLARGFQWGWQPHWMACDLADWSNDAPPPAGVELAEATGDVDWSAADLPYHDVAWEGRFGALLAHRPSHTRIFFASQGSTVRGKVVLHVQPDGAVAGIYECGVVESARRRGIGAALTAAALRAAQDMGCTLAVLNATPLGTPVYARAGFVSAGWGQTWWLPARRGHGRPPAPRLVALVEAIADQHSDRLRRCLASLRARPKGFDGDARLACGLRPLEVAAQLGRPDSARVLISEGCHLDVLTAWDLRWRDEAAELLRKDPGAASRPLGRDGTTPVHKAVERDDEPLLRLLLAAHPDLNVRDRVYHGTPLGWAEHLDRPRLAQLLRHYARP